MEFFKGIFKDKNKALELEEVREEYLRNQTDIQLICVGLARLLAGVGVDDEALITELYNRSNVE